MIHYLFPVNGDRFVFRERKSVFDMEARADWIRMYQ